MRKRKFSPTVDHLEGRQLLATFTVTNLGDSGSGSLRGAIQASNVTPGPNTINFQGGLSGTIQLTSGELQIQNNAVTINGPGASVVAVDGSFNGLHHLMRVDNVAATVNGLTFENGHDSTSGGAVVNLGGVVTLNQDNFVNNVADQWGGAIASTNGGVLNVNASQFFGNRSTIGGGAITSWATATLNGDVFVGNSTAQYGGAVENASLTLGMTATNDQYLSNSAAWGGAVAQIQGVYTSTNDTYIANHASVHGGAFVDLGGTATLNGGVMEYNSSDQFGGAITTVAPLVLNNPTIIFNHATLAAGGVFAKAGTLTQIGGNIRFNTPTDIVFFS